MNIKPYPLFFLLFAGLAGGAEAAGQSIVGDEEMNPGRAYLLANVQNPGVKVMPSGLQFKVLKRGGGKAPGLTSRVVAHYHGTLIDGQVFDSSVERGQPAEFAVNRLIKGWTQALQMMQEGDKWRLFIPPELAYGKQGSGGKIPPDSTLIFDVELLEVKD